MNYYNKEALEKNNEYLNKFLNQIMKYHFGIELAPKQSDVLRIMLFNKYSMLIHGKGTGATFLLSVLGMLYKLMNSHIRMAVVGEPVRQAELLIETGFNKLKKKSAVDYSNVDVISIDKVFVDTDYDLVLLDEITEISDAQVDAIIEQINHNTKPKIVASCVGYRPYYPIQRLMTVVYSKGESICMSCEDMPKDWYDEKYMEKAKKQFKFKEEFDMEYKCTIV